MKISVTAEDIARGQQGDCQMCPVALAIARAVQPVKPLEILVGGWYAVLYNNRTAKEVWNADLPEEVSPFIYTFDAGEPVQPFDFDLEIPDA